LRAGFDRWKAAKAQVIAFCLLGMFAFCSFLYYLLPKTNAIAAVSKGMQAVKLCAIKVFQFSTGGASKYKMAVKWLLRSVKGWLRFIV